MRIIAFLNERSVSILPNWVWLLLIIGITVLCTSTIIRACSCYNKSALHSKHDFNRTKNIGNSFRGIYFTVTILIMFAIVAIDYLKSNYDQHKQIVLESEQDAISLSLIDMQSATLAISALVVTLASVIISVLTLYRERKTEINNQYIDESIRNIEIADKEIQALSTIISIQFIDENQRECYHDAIRDYLASLEVFSNSLLSARFNATRLSVINGVAKIESNPTEQLELYQSIVRIGKSILKGNSTVLDRNFALLETLHALYHIIKLKIDADPNSAHEDINTAMRYLKMLSTSNDSYGHIANTKGLIKLWSGIAEKRMSNDSKAKTYLNASLQLFEEALLINPNKVQFLNHKAVALQQIYDIEHMILNKDLKQRLI